MEHIDPEQLDALALGEEQPSAAQQSHLDACDECRDSVASARRTAGAIRSVRDLAVTEAPDSVWAAIHAELALDPTLAPAPKRGVLTDVAQATPPATPTEAQTETETQPETEAEPTPESGPAPAARAQDPGIAGSAAVVPLTRRGRPERNGGDLAASTRPRGRGRSRRAGSRRWLVPAIAAGVALVLGVGGGLGIARVLQPGTGDVVATARLAALPDWPDATGTATLRELPDGGREVQVEVDTTGEDVDAPLREVWLLTPDASGLVSIGFLDGATGTFRVPADVDLSAYPIVDVSAEPQDGNPAHSGDSIVRGELGAS
ncbi:anti-sigma factor domain-containing protein [Labedella endophytica]|uniref:Anti-sigma K factor RskA C-terminal domain-containing protein n=1 Tax=Labedella endophytica TaxID=1523160 RepID=A0A3S0WZ65_9MICO|nr:anti-sigma factor [Labedella endophytica]RUR01706.1 hypothetical protein ELQ94_09575 [Labedella endophytica]